MHGVIFPLLAHEQLSVREHAIKTFSSYLSRSEFQVNRFEKQKKEITGIVETFMLCSSFVVCCNVQ